MRMVRVNELSLERLHRQAACSSGHISASIGPAFLSFNLRAPSALRGPFKFTLDDMALACNEIRQPLRLQHHFGLALHPGIHDPSMRAAAKGINNSQCLRNGQILHEVCYHADKHVLYDPKIELKHAIKEYNRQVKDAEAARLGDPMEQFGKIETSAEMKLNGLLCKYGFRHFKEHVSFTRNSMCDRMRKSLHVLRVWQTKKKR